MDKWMSTGEGTTCSESGEQRMEFFRNLTIARKLAIAFTVTTLATLALGGFAIQRLGQTGAQLDEVRARYMPAVQYLERMRSDLAEIRIAELSQLARADEPEFVAEYSQRILDQKDKLAEHQKQYESLPASDEQKRLYAGMKATMASYLNANLAMEKAIHAGEIESAHTISNEQSRISRRELFDAVEKLSSYVASSLDREIDATHTVQARSNSAILICMALLGLLSVGLGTVIVRSIVRPLGEALQVADDVASGRLGGRINIGRNDEIGRLLLSMQRMQHQIKDVISAQSEMTRQPMKARSASASTNPASPVSTPAWCTKPTLSSRNISA
jgi:methyl-accepting chemotaxis protein